MSVDFVIPTHNSRFLAFPVIGWLMRFLLLIPHYLLLTIVGLFVLFAQFVLWIPVLIAGHYPRWGYHLVGGYLRWQLRVAAYTYGLTDRYPPFRLRD